MTLLEIALEALEEIANHEHNEGCHGGCQTGWTAVEATLKIKRELALNPDAK